MFVRVVAVVLGPTLTVLVENDADRSQMSFNLMLSMTNKTSPAGKFAYPPAEGLLEIAFEKSEEAKRLAVLIGAKEVSGDGETGPWTFDLDAIAYDRLEGLLPPKATRSPLGQAKPVRRRLTRQQPENPKA